MVQIEIVEALFEEIERKFKKKADEIYKLIDSLKDNPKKGKPLGSVGGILIKELKYNNFRFYFLVEGFKLKFLSTEELTDLLLIFVRMSNKKHQQETIDKIKEILRAIGPCGF